MKEKEKLDPEQIFQFSFHLPCLNGFHVDDDDHEIFILMHYLLSKAGLISKEKLAHEGEIFSL